jgi:hypothetical protein
VKDAQEVAGVGAGAGADAGVGAGVGVRRRRGGAQPGRDETEDEQTVIGERFTDEGEDWIVLDVAWEAKAGEGGGLVLPC